MFKGFWWGVYDRVTNVKYLENLCTVEAELTNPVPGSLSVPAVGVAAAATPSVQMLPEIPPPSCQELVPPSERTSLPTSAFFKEKSDEEISDLLDQYGIRHGPIVASTRGLYEKKVEEAMENAPQQPSSDKTYYREEEEVTYITYSPVKHEGHGDLVKRNVNTEQDEVDESDQDAEPPVQPSRSPANHRSVPSKQPVSKRGGCLWRGARLLLVLFLLAAAFYYVYCHLLQRDGGALESQ